jgi:hypothetical protein
MNRRKNKDKKRKKTEEQVLKKIQLTKNKGYKK